MRPGITLGYGSMPGNYYVDSTEYLIVKPSLEILVLSSTGTMFVYEIGFLSAPTGGNTDYSVSLSPTLLLRAGIIF